MEFWIKTWTCVLVLNLFIFAGLAIAVSIGGFGDVLSMLRSIRTQNDGQSDTEHED